MVVYANIHRRYAPADNIKSLIAARRRMGVKGKRLRKAPKILTPDGLGRDYKRMLRLLVDRLRKRVEAIFDNQLPTILNQLNKNIPTNDSVRMDDETIVDKLRALIRSSYAEADAEFAEAKLNEIAKRIGGNVSDFNRQQVSKVITQVIGIDPFISEPWLAEKMALFVSDNAALISTVKDKYMAEVERTVLSGARSGLRHEEISKQIQERGGVAESNADRIARDQVNKFNGQLNGLRQESLGIKSYIWHTVGDANVRDSHAELNGTEQEWANPPSEGNPGDAINCRCWAEPKFDAELTVDL